MKTKLVATAALALLAAPIPAHAEEAPCGVGMPVTMRAGFDKHLIDALGNFVADGELVGDNGHHSCIAVTIECSKNANLCAMVDVPVVKIGGKWEIVSIVPQRELPISTWNDRFITSAGDSNLCNRREVTVDIEKQRIRVVQTNSCDPSVPATTYYIQPPPILGKVDK